MYYKPRKLSEPHAKRAKDRKEEGREGIDYTVAKVLLESSVKNTVRTEHALADVRPVRKDTLRPFLGATLTCPGDGFLFALPLDFSLRQAMDRFCQWLGRLPSSAGTIVVMQAGASVGPLKPPKSRPCGSTLSWCRRQVIGPVLPITHLLDG